MQCPKLRMHPSPSVHISTAGCTVLEGVHPVCARFLSHLLLLYIGRVHGAISGCAVLGEVHPASAKNESLISDTAFAVVKHHQILGSPRPPDPDTYTHAAQTSSHYHKPPSGPLSASGPRLFTFCSDHSPCRKWLCVVGMY